MSRTARTYLDSLGRPINFGNMPNVPDPRYYNPQSYQGMTPYQAQNYQNYGGFQFERYDPMRMEVGPKYQGRDYQLGPQFQAQQYQAGPQFNVGAHWYTPGATVDRYGVDYGKYASLPGFGKLEGAPTDLLARKGAFTGPMKLAYEGKRVTPWGMVDAAQLGRTYEGTVQPTESVRADLGRGPLANKMPVGDWNLDPNAVEQSMLDRHMSRIEPQQKQEQAALADRLASQGIVPGSAAYNDEMARLSRRHTDQTQAARSEAVAAGRAEHGRLVGQSQSLRRQERGELESDRSFIAGERGRRFGETLASRGFDAAEDQRGYGQRADRQRFIAGERGRDFGERLSSEGQYFDQRYKGSQFEAQQHWRRNQMYEGQRQFDAGMHQADRQFGATHNLRAGQYGHSSAQQDRQFGAGLGSRERMFGHSQAQQDRQFQGTHQQRGDIYGHQAAQQDRQWRDTLWQQDRQFGAGHNLRGDMYGHQAGQQDWQYGAGLNQADRHFARTTNMADRHFGAGLDQRDRMFGHTANTAADQQHFENMYRNYAQNISNQLLARGVAKGDVEGLLGLVGAYLGITNPRDPNFQNTRAVDHTGSQRTKEGTETSFETGKKSKWDYVPL